MKKIVFLFCFLPIFSFGQTITLEIDSVSLVRYNGSNKSKPKPKPKPKQGKKHEDIKYSKQEIDTLRVRYPKAKYLSPYDDMYRNKTILFRGGQGILDKNGRFHPKTKKETYQTFPADSIKYLLEILDCKAIEKGKIVGRDTTYTVDEKGDTIQDIIITMTLSNRPPLKCYAPGLGVLLWSKGRIITFYSVCFNCNGIVEGPIINYQLEYKRCINLDLLKEEIEELGYSLK
ncbi:MAG: hypothetical protein AB8G11_19490 [Saprospiraceae bacterium]